MPLTFVYPQPHCKRASTNVNTCFLTSQGWMQAKLLQNKNMHSFPSVQRRTWCQQQHAVILLMTKYSSFEPHKNTNQAQVWCLETEGRFQIFHTKTVPQKSTSFVTNVSALLRIWWCPHKHPLTNTYFLQRPWGGPPVWWHHLPGQQALRFWLAQLLSATESGPLKVWRQDRGPQDRQQVRRLFVLEHRKRSSWYLKKKMSPVQFWCSFLCLVPDEAKSSYQVEGTGYDTYLRDAHRQVRLTLQNVWLDDEQQDAKWRNIPSSSGTIVVSASGGTGGGIQSLLRSVTWTSRSSRATSSRFSLTGWVASWIRSVGSFRHPTVHVSFKSKNPLVPRSKQNR